MTEGKCVQMTQEDLQEGRFQAVMQKQVTIDTNETIAQKLSKYISLTPFCKTNILMSSS